MPCSSRTFKQNGYCGRHQPRTGNILKMSLNKNITLPLKMSLNKIITLPLKKLRASNQLENNKLVFDAIMKDDKKMFKNNINHKELARTLVDLKNISCEKLLRECRENFNLCTLLSRLISKNASRQGSKVEKLQLTTCNTFSKHYGITIEKLSAKAYRPTKGGIIVDQQCMKDQCIQKHECLKSFDGKISGKINGWIFAKAVYASGGHQDNVFEEADVFCKWVSTFKPDSKELFVVLIDTDLTEKFTMLKEKYCNDNLFIGGHVSFQQFICDKYDRI